MAELAGYREPFAQLVACGETYAEALRKSHPPAKKWKEQTVWVNSSKLMAETKVKLRVKEIQEENLKRNQVTLEEVLEEMANWLRFDPIELFDDDDCLKKMSDLAPEVRKSLASPIEVLELFEGTGENRKLIGYLKKVRPIDKSKIGDMWLKKFGAYVTKFKIDDQSLDHIQEILSKIER